MVPHVELGRSEYTGGCAGHQARLYHSKSLRSVGKSPAIMVAVCHITIQQASEILRPDLRQDEHFHGSGII
jgi:hypothetical protein